MPNRKLPQGVGGYRPHSGLRAPRLVARKPCDFCRSPSLDLDVAGILYPRNVGGFVPAVHRRHIAERLTESAKFASGSHGDRIVEALEWSIVQARNICEAALAANQPRVALEALRVIGDVASSEAKIVGVIPKTKSMHVHMPAFTAEQAQALLADVAATALPAPVVEAVVVESSPGRDRS